MEDSGMANLLDTIAESNEPQMQIMTKWKHAIKGY
jgi:hypothetical protein